MSDTYKQSGPDTNTSNAEAMTDDAFTPDSTANDAFADVPAVMKQAQRWLLWKAEPVTGKKPRKVPHYADGTKRLKTDTPDDQANLVGFDAALAALGSEKSYAGLGFALGPDGTGNYWQGIDLDDIADHPGLDLIADALPGYTEDSPSGKGRHAFGYGRQFPSFNKSKDFGIEAYATGRYFTVTGNNAGTGEPLCMADFVEQRLVPITCKKADEGTERPRHRSTQDLDLIRDLRSALGHLSADEYDEWIAVGQALKPLGDEGLALWLDWSQTSDKWESRDAKRWETFDADRTGYQSIFAKAQRAGWSNPGKRERADGTSSKGDSEESSSGFTPHGDESQGPIPLNHDPLKNLPAFPLEALPECLSLAAKEVARFDKVPVESPATIALAMLATAIGKSAMVEERDGLDHFPALFFCLIAASGERKSPPFRRLQYPFVKYIEDMQERFAAVKSEVEASNAVVQSRIKRLHKDAERAGTQLDRQDIARQISQLRVELQPLPMDPRRFTSDCTEQVLFKLMEQHGGEYSILSGEGRPVMDAILGKYSGDGRTGDGIILAGISGDTITRDRVGSVESGGQENGVILHPCLNVCVMIQPDKYLQAARHPNLRASGALARIFPVWLPSLVGTRLEEQNEPGLNGRALAGYNAIVRSLLDVDQGEPHRVTLSAEAAEHRRKFHNAIEQMMGHEGDYADVRDIASKATSQTVKLGLVLHIAMNPSAFRYPQSEINLETMQRATALGLYFLQQAVASQRSADEDNVLSPARLVLDWMKKESRTKGKTRFTFAEIQQRSPRPRPTAKDLVAIMDVLVDHRQVMAIDEGAKHPDYQLRGNADAK